MAVFSSQPRLSVILQTTVILIASLLKVIILLRSIPWGSAHGVEEKVFSDFPLRIRKSIIFLFSFVKRAIHVFNHIDYIDGLIHIRFFIDKRLQLINLFQKDRIFNPIFPSRVDQKLRTKVSTKSLLDKIICLSNGDIAGETRRGLS